MADKALKDGHQTRSDQQTLREADLGCRVEPQGCSAESGEKSDSWDGRDDPLKAINEILVEGRLFIQLIKEGFLSQLYYLLKIPRTSKFIFTFFFRYGTKNSMRPLFLQL